MPACWKRKKDFRLKKISFDWAFYVEISNFSTGWYIPWYFLSLLASTVCVMDDSNRFIRITIIQDGTRNLVSAPVTFFLEARLATHAR